MSNLIETGTKLELKKIRHIDSALEVCYVSRFLYQKSVDEAVIEMPTKTGLVIPLEPDEWYQICFYTKKGLYQCQCQVLSRHYEDSLPVAVVKFRSEFEKLQRRQYYRMESLLQMAFRTVSEEELKQLAMEKDIFHKQVAKEEGADVGEQSPSVRFYSGIVLDISGGGVRFNSEHEAAPGDYIVLKIAFMTDHTKQLQMLFAKVLTVVPVQNRLGLYEHRVEFTAISNMERESIIRYIFLEERKRRKRESGNE